MIARAFRAVSLAATGLMLSAGAAGAEGPINVRLHHEIRAEREAQARQELLALHQKYNLERWIFTREVIVESGAIPHSHPVLTVNTRYLGDEIGALSAYLHEQLHWYAVENEAAVDAAIADLEEIFPDAPVGGADGARDKNSTYLHLIVCMLEFDALTELFGEAAAREELGSKRFYQWIYAQVLENEAPIRNIMKNNNISPP